MGILRVIAVLSLLFWSGAAQADYIPSPYPPPAPPLPRPERPRPPRIDANTDAYLGVVLLFIAASATIVVIERRRGRGRLA